MPLGSALKKQEEAPHSASCEDRKAATLGGEKKIFTEQGGSREISS